MHRRPTADRRFRAPEDGGAPPAAPPAADTPPPGAAPADPPAATPAAPAAPAAKWWEGLPQEQRAYLTPKGLTTDDPMEALPRLIAIASHAEKRIGKGLDSIIEKPGKGQAWSDWAAANREALGLPADAAAYEVKPPEGWPKDLPWDGAAEAAAREIAFKHGVPPEAHKAYVEFQANALKAAVETADKELAAARTAMMAELQKDWGQQTDARLTQARQAAQYLAEQAGINPDGLQALTATLSEKVGDAGVMRIFAKVAEMMGDDTGIALNKGGSSFAMTPAEARAEIARFEGESGDYGKAVRANDVAKIAALRPRRDELYRIATSG